MLTRCLAPRIFPPVVGRILRGIQSGYGGVPVERQLRQRRLWRQADLPAQAPPDLRLCALRGGATHLRGRRRGGARFAQAAAGGNHTRRQLRRRHVRQPLRGGQGGAPGCGRGRRGRRAARVPIFVPAGLVAGGCFARVLRFHRVHRRRNTGGGVGADPLPARRVALRHDRDGTFDVARLCGVRRGTGACSVSSPHCEPKYRLCLRAAGLAGFDALPPGRGSGVGAEPRHGRPAAAVVRAGAGRARAAGGGSKSARRGDCVGARQWRAGGWRPTAQGGKDARLPAGTGGGLLGAGRNSGRPRRSTVRG
mmetsp:Transcript_12526/g.41083  ORF Transcript_12526/g.41083 Transcript_12526/m.41083 type:complete len:308 (-) Transcript_12526:1326-2249(-)